MSQSTPKRERPLSPFMIGPYYRPQLTSVLSITHRITGILLAVGAFGLGGWLLAVAGGPAAYATFAECAGGVLGRLAVAGLTFSLIYHWLNGLRHLLWDVGWGLEIRRAYATGWAVVALAAVGTIGVLMAAFGGVA